MTQHTDLLAKGAAIAVGSAIAASLAMIDAAIPVIEKLGVSVSLGVAGIYMWWKSAQAQIKAMEKTLQTREDELKQATTHRIEMIGTLKDLNNAIGNQTEIIKANNETILRALNHRQP